MWLLCIGVLGLSPRSACIRPDVDAARISRQRFLVCLIKGAIPNEVRNGVANALIRDRMPYRLVIQRMREDFGLELSLGYIHTCFLWAHEQINMEEHWDFVCANFSGVLCLDEVHDSGRTILFATDPLNNLTVSFTLAEHNDQAHMDTFLQAL